MTSAVAQDFIRSSIKIEKWDHDPGATTAIVVSPDGGTTKRVVDMALVKNLAVAAMLTVPAAGAITLLEIIASESSDMASPEIIKTSGVIAADATGDWAVLECDAAELAQAGAETSKELRYAAGRLTISNAGAEAEVTYVSIPVHAYRNLTPATTIA